MKETRTVNEDGDLVITLEPETPEEMAEFREFALAVIQEGLAEDTDLTAWFDDETEDSRG